jgi:hypothetical protein
MPNVKAVVLNVTVTGPTQPSFFTLYPSDASRPNASNLNFVPGETRANATTGRIGNDGKVRIYNHVGQAHVIVDVGGYYGPESGGGLKYNPLSPARILDTRNGTGGVANKIGANQALYFQVTGKGGVPLSGVDTVVLNVTATQPTAASYLNIYPADQAPRPTASSLNFLAGDTVPNLVTVKLSPMGRIQIYNAFGSVHVVVDVAGWYGAGSGGHLFHPITPARALDTRDGTGGHPGKLGPGAELNLLVAGQTGLPGSVTGVVANVTVTGPTSGSFLTVFPANVPKPVASNLNFVANQTAPNLVSAMVAPDGRVKIHNHAGSTHVIADVAGWFAP